MLEQSIAEYQKPVLFDTSQGPAGYDTLKWNL